MIMIRLAFPLLLLGAPALASPSGAQIGSLEVTAEKPVCKRLVVTGSRIAGKRVCRTRAEWDADARRAQDAARSLQRSRETERTD